MKHWHPSTLPNAQSGRLIGYARVSTYEQKLDIQLNALKQAGCKSIFQDRGLSGALAERPGLDKALHALAAGDTLVVYKLDRLGRSVLHLADLITRLDANGVQFCSLTEGIDTTTSGGKLVFHVFAAVAEFSRNLIRENTRAGLMAARERGAQIGRPRCLTDEQVLEAQSYMQERGKSPDEAAARFGVSASTLRRSIHRIGANAVE
ncbi:recombinase family protein [Roseibium sp. Sym1]|uniref:recombinase family protein n=1 Tax=Roseibium sp. Sym1 TaxID=3016006 RepID=UPI0022B3FC0D|nr:recombinase family protein [Roseibium sp. Sym1]